MTTRETAWAIGRKANWVAAYRQTGFTGRGRRINRECLKRLQVAFGQWLDRADKEEKAANALNRWAS